LWYHRADLGSGRCRRRTRPCFSWLEKGPFDGFCSVFERSIGIRNA